MKNKLYGLIVVLAIFAGGTSQAALLGIQSVDVPFVFLTSLGTLSYEPSSDRFQANLDPGAGYLEATISFQTGPTTSAPIECRAMPDQAQGRRCVLLDFYLGSDGKPSVVGGAPGNDLEFWGSIDADNDGTPEYDGLLLTGEILDFGYHDTGTINDAFDARFRVSGGLLAERFGNGDIGLRMDAETSTFVGHFDRYFASGKVKGNLGPVSTLPASLGDKVWLDENRDGIQDDGEPGIDGVSVGLTDCAGGQALDFDGSPVLGTFTNGQGYYEFTNLQPNFPYCVQFTAPDGLIFTKLNGTNDTSKDSNADPGTGLTLPVSLDSGEFDPTIDAGLYVPDAPNEPVCDLRIEKTCEVPPPASNFTQCTTDIQSLTMFWEGIDGPVTIVAHEGDASKPVVDTKTGIMPGDEVTIGNLANAPNDVIWEIFRENGDGSLTKIGESKFHLSCSDDEMDGETDDPMFPNDCRRHQGNGKSNESGLIDDWMFEGMVDADEILDCTPEESLVESTQCSYTPTVAPNCGTDNDTIKPDTLTWQYTGGGCSVSNNGQIDSTGDWSCSGTDPNLFADPNAMITIYDDKGGVSQVRLGEELTILRDAAKELVLVGPTGTQTITMHTSCSQPLVAGERFGALTLSALDGQRDTSFVTYHYTVANLGSELVDVLVTDVAEIDGELESSDIAFFDKLEEGAEERFSLQVKLEPTIDNLVANRAVAAGLQPDTERVCSSFASDQVVVTIDEPCLECKGGTVELILEYKGPEGAFVEIVDDGSYKTDKLLFADKLRSGERIALLPRPGKDKFNNDVTFWVDGVRVEKFKSDCSKPLGPGLSIGGVFDVLKAYSKDNGAMCPLFEDCKVAGFGLLEFDGNKVDWALTNNSGNDLIIERIQISWPSANGGLKKIKLDGDEFYNQLSWGPSVDVSGGWHDDLNKRVLSAGDTEELRFEFEDDAVFDNEAYQITVDFMGETCTAVFVPGDMPEVPFVCSDAKPIDGLSLIWAGLGTVDVYAYAGSPGSTLIAEYRYVQTDNLVRVDGYELNDSPNDVYFEIFDSTNGDFLGESAFHLSCSDDAMDGETDDPMYPNDCGRLEGNNKGDDPDLLNSWRFDGMRGFTSALECGLPNNGEVTPSNLAP